MPDIKMIQLDPSKSCLSCLNRQCHAFHVVKKLVKWGNNLMVLKTVDEAHISKNGIPAVAIFVAVANACLEYEPDEAYAHTLASETRKDESS